MDDCLSAVVLLDDPESVLGAADTDEDTSTEVLADVDGNGIFS